MKTPIAVPDIRKGDLIRAGFGTVTSTRMTALEYRAERDGDRYDATAVAWQLLDRPEPAVELPETPTLGWLDVTDMGRIGAAREGRVLGLFKGRDGVADGGPVGTWSHEFISAFTPATAVPTDALDDLRKVVPEFGDLGSRVVDFLTAVDQANT